jgi:hypothetical protein
MTPFSASLQQRQNEPVPAHFFLQSLNQTLNQSEAIVEVLINGLSGVGTISLTVTEDVGSGSQTGASGVNQTSMTTSLAGSLPLTQVPPFNNGSVIPATTSYTPTGFATNTFPSLPSIAGATTVMTNFTGASGPNASDRPDGSVSLLLVLFRAVFGGA